MLYQRIGNVLTSYHYLMYMWNVNRQCNSYRPISLTSVCCKVLESTLKDNIMEHLECNKLINDSQHGFRSGRSYVTNLLTFLVDLT